ncbi:glutathione S-transferase C-terminal domain-containing protein [Methylocapsa aurea]|uniref:glutathione S-transferase C-terminal domain-containing protein n=1 Tax=Methylocapsa aurea TaxID=663610 RepID=UPI000B1CCB21|nr:glutathione S-transferase C-terminal domain-containing protein [Methylocapsa aurea]
MSAEGSAASRLELIDANGERGAYASAVDYEVFGRYASADKLKKMQRANSQDAVAAFNSLTSFRNRIGSADSAAFAPEPGRYHLYLGKGCPFCHRVLIALNVLDLAKIITFSFVDDERDGRGWAFRARRGADPVNGFLLLREAYEATDADFDGHVSVPVLWDRRTGTIVSNNSGDILVDVATQFRAHANSRFDLYPASLREEIEDLDASLHADVNFGVYAVGLSKSQAEYESAATRLFDRLAFLDERLASRRFLFGADLTQSDIRLWVTLARFDVAYNPIFRANLKRLVDYPHLWGYARDLYQIPAFRDSTDFAQHKLDYIRNFPELTPSGIVPIGPIVDWSEPSGREPLAGASA